MQISSSILSTSDKKEAINKLNNTNIDYIHFDIMDGLFVANKAFSIEEIKEYAKITNKKIDAHFMVENPIYFLNNLKDIDFDIFTFHIEVDNVDEIIKKLKKTYYKIGLAIKPNTNINTLKPYLDDIDLTMYEDMVYRSISTNELIVALVYCTSDSSIHPIYPISWEDKLSSALPNVGDSAFSNIITVSYSSICSQIKLIKELSVLAFITPLLCIVMLIIICEVIKRINTRR